MAKGKPQFTKIVANGKAVQIHWLTKKKTASDVEEQQSHVLDSPERPRPEFDKALQAFRPYLLTIIGAPKDWNDSTEVIGISLNENEERSRGVVITARRKCPYGSAPIAINTPHLRESIDVKETGPTYLLPGMVEAIDRMCEEAQTYLDGDRAQGELFGDEGGEDKKRKGKGPELVGDVLERSRAKARAD